LLHGFQIRDRANGDRDTQDFRFGGFRTQLFVVRNAVKSLNDVQLAKLGLDGSPLSACKLCRY
jgi:hypothetical protein